MSKHLDLDALADLLDGEGDGEAHLSGCAHCAARLGELADAEAAVTASLNSLGAPTLPPALADRIAAALAAEPALAPAPAAPATPADVVAGAGAGPAGLPSAAAVPSAATVTPLPSRSTRSTRSTRRLRGHPAWLQSVAAGAVLLLGAGIGYTVLRDDGGSSEQTAAAGRESGTSLRSNDSGVDYADAAAAASALPSVLAGRATAGRTAGSQAADAPPPAAPKAESTAGSTAGSTAVPQGAAGEGAAGDPLARLRQPAALASCLVALLPPEEPDLRPLALDYARYAGAPALAVVLPDPDPTKVSIFVVGPDCVATADDLKFFTRLARP